MEFAYTPEQVDLQERASAFTAVLMQHEDAVEAAGGVLVVGAVAGVDQSFSAQRQCGS